MLKPDYIDIDKDGNTTEPMKKAAKERDMKSMGGLLEDDREQYVVGGLSKMLSKGISKVLKPNKVKQEINEIEKFLLDNKYPEADIFTKQELNKVKKEIGSDLEYLDYLSEFKAVKEADIDYIKRAKKNGMSSAEIKNVLENLERNPKQEGGPMSMDDQMKAALIIPMEEKENMSMDSEMPMESDEDMEDNYTRFIMEEALTEDEEDMLMSKLEQDEELAMLFDKVIDVAQEFAGSGPVEGPGSGVSDSIPARLSDGEFVFTAKAVEEIGADNLMAMMKDAEMKADERQGLVTGGPVTDVEEERVVLEPEKAPAQQINITKETVDSPAIARDEEDMIGDDIKKSMLGQSRNI
jgi:DNA-binding transcriptional MerR regulator